MIRDGEPTQPRGYNTVSTGLKAARGAVPERGSIPRYSTRAVRLDEVLLPEGSIPSSPLSKTPTDSLPVGVSLFPW